MQGCGTPRDRGERPPMRRGGAGDKDVAPPALDRGGEAPDHTRDAALLRLVPFEEGRRGRWRVIAVRFVPSDTGVRFWSWRLYVACMDND